MWELHNVEESCAEQQWRNSCKSIESVRLRAAKNRPSTLNPVLFRAFRWDLLFMSVAVTECTTAHCNRQTTSEPSQHSQVPLWHYALINGKGNGPPQVRVSFLLTAKSGSFILFIVINIHFLIMCLKMHFWMMLSHIKMTRCIFIKVPLSSSVASPPEFVSVGWNQVFTTK